VADDPEEDLTNDQRAWILHSEALWREAQEIVGGNPNHDVGTVYHALRNLEQSPAERLHRGLTRVRRTRPHAR
jgi:hypothetical protein